MASIQTIGIGTIANDGTGDTLRNAFDKTNQNFASLNTTTPKLVNKSILSYSNTGVTTLQLVGSATIATGTFSANDMLFINAYFTKVGASASYNATIWINTSLSLTGATQIGIYTTPVSAILYTPISRSFYINTNILYGSSFTTSNLTDATGNKSSATFTTTAPIYIMFAMQTSSTTDTMQFNGFKITN